MPATRNLEKITIYFDLQTQLPNTVEAKTMVVAQEQGLTVTAQKGYSVEYETLGAAAQAKVDDFVGDVTAFINAQEPITGP